MSDREFCPTPTIFTLDPETRLLRDTRTGLTFPMKDFSSYLPVVTLDAGHGVKAPGYYAFGTQRGGAQEHVLARDLATRVGNELIKRGYNVIITRDSDRTYNLDDAFSFRHDAARLATAAYLSLHVNGSTVPSQNGTELFSDSRLGDDHPSHRLRRQLAGNLSGRVQQGRSDWRMLNPAFIGDVPAVLVEAGYLTHDGDFANLTNKAWRQTFASRLAASVDGFHRARTGARNVDAECDAGLQMVIRSILGFAPADDASPGDFMSSLPSILRVPPREKTPRAPGARPR